MDWRLSQTKRPAIVTLKNERTAIRQLLKFAKRRGYIPDVPEFEIKSGRINSRPDIPEVEWNRLIRFLPGYIDRAQDKRRQRERFYLALYILIMGNTGIRIGEARRIRWRDVSTTRTLTDEVGQSSPSAARPGKGGCLQQGCRALLGELRSYRTEEFGEIPSDQEYVFCHPFEMPVGSFKGGFQRALRKLASCMPRMERSASPRLAEGVSVSQLAASMGTSVEMLEDFYRKKRMRRWPRR